MSKEKESVATAAVVIAEAMSKLQTGKVILHADGSVKISFREFLEQDINYPSVSAWLKEALGSSAKTVAMFDLEARCLKAGFDKACVRTGSAEGRADDLVVSLGGLKATIELVNNNPLVINKIDLVNARDPNPVIRVEEMEMLLDSGVDCKPGMGDYTARALLAIAKACDLAEMESEPWSNT